MTDEEIAHWNATVASGDTEAIAALQHELIDALHLKLMDEDANYATAGWTVS